MAIFLLLFGLLRFQSQAQLGLPPVITVPPLDQTVKNGGSATFTVVVTSLTHLTYQWRFNGINIPGATGNRYTRTNCQYADDGMYSVAVTNAAGWAVSSNAKLTVLNPPLRFVSCGRDTNGFKAHLVGPAGATYIIHVSNDLVNWRPISTNSAPTGTLDFVDPRGTNHGPRFYRGQVK